MDPVPPLRTIRPTTYWWREDLVLLQSLLKGIEAAELALAATGVPDSKQAFKAALHHSRGTQNFLPCLREGVAAALGTVGAQSDL